MSTISNISTGQQVVTATGAVTPTAGLDISGLSATGDYTIHLRVQALSSASGTPKARIVLEDTVTAFTAAVPVAMVDVVGTIDSKSELHFSWRKYQTPSARIGTASALLRANVESIGGTTPTLTLDAWIET